MSTSLILFAIWIGLGVVALPVLIRRIEKDPENGSLPVILALATTVLVMGPIMFYAAYFERPPR